MDMSINGKSPTAVEVDGIVIDLNRVSRPEFRRFIREITAAGDDPDKADQLSGEYYAKVIISWPFGEVTPESYLAMGMLDAGRVDAAFREVSKMLEEKKLEPPSTSQESTANP